MGDNSWHEHMYSKEFARLNIDSRNCHANASKEVDFIFSMLDLHAGKVLDVPCGTGRHSRIIVERGFQVTGLDISDACLELAAENCRQAEVTLAKARSWGKSSSEALVRIPIILVERLDALAL